MYDKAVDDFNSNVEKILNKEINRLEEERLLAEAIEANAGKDLDFFQTPELLTREKFGYGEVYKKRKTASVRVINSPQKPLEEDNRRRWNFY